MDTGTMSKKEGADVLATENSDLGNLHLETREEMVSEVELSKVNKKNYDLENI